MSNRVLICHAWPYANSSLHPGHLAGVHVPADVFARYNRLRGKEVLVVSGSDEHGTPITLRAEQEGVSPQVIADRYHSEFLECWDRLSIHFDNYTRTTTQNHKELVQQQFLDLLDKGFIFRDTTMVLYDDTAKRYLPDRYVEGTCPHCNADSARGDQCDTCGRPLNALDLLNPKSRLTGTVPIARNSEHFFLDLPKLQTQLTQWTETRRGVWRSQVYNFTIRFLADGLKPRAITRDLEWGIPIPLQGFDGKCIYVWFEAVTGYFSASVEWAKRQGDPDAWKNWWLDPDTKQYYFIGKDNIPFHTIIWPGILLARGDLQLPYDVPANEFLNLGDAKFSKSKGTAVSVLELLGIYGPEPLRYYVLAIAPETADSKFSFDGLVERNNQDLVGVWGNLVHRTLTFTQRYFQGKVPAHTPDPVMLNNLESAIDRITGLIERVHLRDALREVMTLATYGNQYFNSVAPWKTIKTDAKGTGQAIGVLLDMIATLRILFYPFLPESSEKLHRLLGFPGSVSDSPWRASVVTSGITLPEPSPLFRKLQLDETESEALA